MPSPFPGMNPYLEQEDVWPDFHQSFVLAIRDELAAEVPANYFVKVEQHLYIHERSAEERRFFGSADVGLGRRTGATPSSAVRSPPDTPAPAYATIPSPVDVERSDYLEIRDRRGRDLITVIELLSPSNKKPGADREPYLGKRRQLFSSAVHLVELDLLRGGPRLPLDDLPDCDYYAMVSRAEEPPRVAVWPTLLREPLPSIPVPLRSPDAAAEIDLQSLLHRVYDRAHYERHIYEGEPLPRLHPADAAWAGRLIPRSE